MGNTTRLKPVVSGIFHSFGGPPIQFLLGVLTDQIWELPPIFALLAGC